MHFFWFRLFPVILWCCGLVLAGMEIRFSFHESRRLRQRVIRLAGCLMLGILGAMIWFGQLPPSTRIDPAEAWALLRYWGMVFGLLVSLLSLALLDSLDGARALKVYLERVETEEVDRIKQHLSEHGRSVEIP